MVLGVAVLLAQFFLLIYQQLLGAVAPDRVAHLVVSGRQSRAILVVQSATSDKILRFALLNGLVPRFLG